MTPMPARFTPSARRQYKCLIISRPLTLIVPSNRASPAVGTDAAQSCPTQRPVTCFLEKTDDWSGLLPTKFSAEAIGGSDLGTPTIQVSAGEPTRSLGTLRSATAAGRISTHSAACG